MTELAAVLDFSYPALLHDELLSLLNSASVENHIVAALTPPVSPGA